MHELDTSRILSKDCHRRKCSYSIDRIDRRSLYGVINMCTRESTWKDKQIRSYAVRAFEIDSFSKRICLYADVVCVILIEWLHSTRPDKRLLIICRWNCTMFHREATQPAVKPFSRIGNVLLFRGYLISGLRTDDD